MRICSICGVRIASGVCRRYGRPICARCHFHHGLCKSCAKALGKIATAVGKGVLSRGI